METTNYFYVAGKPPTFEVGERVIVRGGFGSEPPETVLIEDIDEKNGRPLILYTQSNGNTRWAYFDQCKKLNY